MGRMRILGAADAELLPLSPCLLPSGGQGGKPRGIITPAPDARLVAVTPSELKEGARTPLRLCPPQFPSAPHLDQT